MPAGLSHLEKNKKKGFTFLEIMVVVTLIIVGLIVVSLAFGGVRKRARDSARVSEIAEIQKALSIYNISANRFPVEPEEIIISEDDSFSQLMQKEFAAKKVPADPLHPAYTYRYISNHDGSDYQLRFCLETNSIPEHKIGCDNIVGP